MVRAVDTGVVNVSNLNKARHVYCFAHAREHFQLSLAVQESADKLRILADLESASQSEQIQAAQDAPKHP
jgi:hypothetical protein